MRIFGPRLGQVEPMWSMLGTSWAQVEPMLGLGRPMLGLCWPRLGLCWAYVVPMLALCWPYVDPILKAMLEAYVGDMLAILGLCWGDVRQLLCPTPTKCRLSLSARHANNRHHRRPVRRKSCPPKATKHRKKRCFSTFMRNHAGR